MLSVSEDIMLVSSLTEDPNNGSRTSPKPTFVNLYGVEKGLEEATRIANEAKGLLSIYGERAVPLCCIADYLVSRCVM